MDTDGGLSAGDGGRAPGAPRRHPCLVTIAGFELGRLYRLTERVTTIGRGTENDIVIAEDAVSRHHARLEKSGADVYVLRDLGSTNGTFRNGERVSQADLHENDKIMIGTATILKFCLPDELELSYQERQFSAATRDWLTQAHNRRYFEDRFEVEFRFAVRHRVDLSVMMLDIDHFKAINDTHGHLVGDRVLRGLCDEVRAVLRREDILARYGGEEFVVLARSIDVAGARALAERCRRRVEAWRFEHDAARVPVTMSLGVAAFVQARHETAGQLIEEADAALYRAKHAGRNRVELYDPEAPHPEETA